MLCHVVDRIYYLEAMEFIAACCLKARNREEESLLLGVSTFREGRVLYLKAHLIRSAQPRILTLLINSKSTD